MLTPARFRERTVHQHRDPAVLREWLLYNMHAGHGGLPDAGTRQRMVVLLDAL